jgi:diguanylate cyclase (GGDEF)-like protein
VAEDRSKGGNPCDPEVPTPERVMSGPPSQPNHLSIPTPCALELRDVQQLLSASHTTAERYTLTVLIGPDAGRVLPLTGLPQVIGRGEGADLRVEDPDVSRSHARVFRNHDGRFMVEDMRSTNGTYVGGWRVHDRRELVSGDRIQCGPNLLLRFAVTDDADEALRRRMFESSTRDFLTRTFNRKYFVERLVAEVAHARRHGTSLAVLVLDLDDFKKLNDEYGHLSGDAVLRAVALRVQRLVRVEDVFARYGGEEFVLLARSTSLVSASSLAERIRMAVQDLQIPTAAGTLRTTVSIGVASVNEWTQEPLAQDLLARADARLYRAKAAGKNCVCFDDDGVVP